MTRISVPERFATDTVTREGEAARLPDPQTIEAPIRPVPSAPGLPLVDDGSEV